MTKYKVLHPIALGGRRERGEVIDMSVEVAEAFGEKYVELYEEADEAEVEESTPEVSMNMSHDELKEEARKRELSVSGTKADLVERITLHDSEEETEEDAEESESDDSEETEEEETEE